MLGLYGLLVLTLRSKPIEIWLVLIKAGSLYACLAIERRLLAIPETATTAVSGCNAVHWFFSQTVIQV